MSWSPFDTFALVLIPFLWERVKEPVLTLFVSDLRRLRLHHRYGDNVKDVLGAAAA